MHANTDTTSESRRRDRTSRTAGGDDATADGDDVTAGDPSSLRRRVRRGAEGGALATLVMTAYRLPVERTLPPTAEFWANYVGGGEPDDHPVAALALHVVYGVAAGGVFAALLPSRRSVDVDAGDRGPPSPSGEVTTTVLGLAYGVVLSVIGENVVMGALLDLDPDDRFAFHVGHVLYGIALGSWLGTRTRAE